MKAGRELDALIAEKVMGWIWYLSYIYAYPNGEPVRTTGRYFLVHPDRAKEGHFADRKWYDVVKRPEPFDDSFCISFHPSTHIAAAWLVVEKLRTNDMHGGIYASDSGGMWVAYFDTQDNEYLVEAPTAPLAICLAALKAVEGGDVK